MSLGPIITFFVSHFNYISFRFYHFKCRTFTCSAVLLYWYLVKDPFTVNYPLHIQTDTAILWSSLYNKVCFVRFQFPSLEQIESVIPVSSLSFLPELKGHEAVMCCSEEHNGSCPLITSLHSMLQIKPLINNRLKTPHWDVRRCET